MRACLSREEIKLLCRGIGEEIFRMNGHEGESDSPGNWKIELELTENPSLLERFHYTLRVLTSSSIRYDDFLLFRTFSVRSSKIIHISFLIFDIDS